MLCSEGRSEEYPAQIYTAYDLMNGRTLISVLFFYDESAYGKTATRLRIEKLLGRLDLSEVQQPQTAAAAE